MVAERFALMHIGDMYLYHWTFQRPDAVVQRYRSVGVCTGVEHDAIYRKSILLHAVDEFSLYIALIVVYLYIGITLPQRRQITFKLRGAVDAWFALSSQIKVGTVHNKYFHLFHLFLRGAKIQHFFKSSPIIAIKSHDTWRHHVS